MINMELLYFENKNNLKEINNNIDFDLWEKEFRNMLNLVLTRKGIFSKESVTNSTLSESKVKISVNES